jgi:hypothetical protein
MTLYSDPTRGGPLGLAALTEREALANLLDALSIAEEASRQLALYTDDPSWILIGSNFGTMRNTCSAFARRSVASR